MAEKYPPYACQCCGIVNGDMFVDYFRHLGREPTETEMADFETYRRIWNENQELKHDIKVLKGDFAPRRVGRPIGGKRKEKNENTRRAENWV